MISVIVPIIRPAKGQRCIMAAHRNAGLKSSEYEVVAEIDHARIGCPAMVAYLVGKAKGDVICFLGDDCIPQPGYLTNSMKAMATLPDGWGMVGLNDGHHNGNVLATHWMADKRLLPLLGGEFFHTGYRHCYCDQELQRRCQEMGRYVWAEDARIIHDHPALKGKPLDETYVGYKRENYLHDLILFRKRARSGWQL